jgi:transposase
MNASDHSRVTLDCGFGGKRVRFRKGSAVFKGSERRTLISNVRIALANIRVPTTPDDSVRLATSAVADAGRRGAAVICFPECFVPGDVTGTRRPIATNQRAPTTISYLRRRSPTVGRHSRARSPRRTPRSSEAPGRLDDWSQEPKGQP